MYKRFFILASLFIGFSQANAQDIWFTRNGNISFHAGTSVEDIDGTNNDVASLINVKTGDIAFTVLVKSFHFKSISMKTTWRVPNFLNPLSQERSLIPEKSISPKTETTPLQLKGTSSYMELLKK
jgi:hypothetical protein